MVEAIKVDTTVDRIRSKSKEDRTFALKLDNHFCPITLYLSGHLLFQEILQKILLSIIIRILSLISPIKWK